MKSLFILILISLIGVPNVHAGSKKSVSKRATKSSKSAVTKKKTSSDESGQLGTSFAFDAASVRGKYQMAGEGIASVENEKVMDDLLGLRTQFKDRQNQENARE